MLRLGLIGYPLGHSLSPIIHEAAMGALGLEGEYRLYPVPHLPTGESHLEGLFQRIVDGELHGLNVTIPHKQTVLGWIEHLSPAAQAVEAVNTIYAIDGKLAGDNTDIAGFRHDLCSHLAGKPEDGQAIVLGAGGSARAVIYALVQEGWQVTIAARRVEQAEQLAASILGATSQAEAIELSAKGIDKTLYHCREAEPVRLIVNTTPVGMLPNIEKCPWPEEAPFPEGAFVYDLVYNPPETRLVKAARLAGLEACNGLGMLVEQAARSFERWTGLTAPRDAMLEAALQF